MTAREFDALARRARQRRMDSDTAVGVVIAMLAGAIVALVLLGVV